MKRFLIFTLIFCISAGYCDLEAQTTKTSPEDYISIYKETAINEMRLYKIPASITLAQGMVESANGNSSLARKANNHFGIKCKSEWKGAVMYYDDDEKGECFRKYSNAWESYRDHSIFLSTRKYYTSLFDLEITDYKGWAKGLKAAGYATNPTYAEMLIKKIEEYELFKYDREALGDTLMTEKDSVTVLITKDIPPDTTRIPIITYDQNDTVDFTDLIDITIGEYNRMTSVINGVHCIKAGADDTYELIAEDFNLSIHELFNYNDLKKNHQIRAGEIVFIEPKKDKGPVEFHLVLPGESMHAISQQYGMRLKSLYSKNHMKRRTDAVSGQRLYLQRKAPVY